MTAPIYIIGHSLGAAEASLYAWSRINRRLPVAGVYLFGCPRPGNSVISTTLSRVPVRSVCNGRDLVTRVPFDLPPLESYANAAPFEMGNAPPPAGDTWGLFAWHHSELYAQACRSLPASPAGSAVGLIEAIDAIVDLYNDTGTWDWRHDVDGQFWHMRIAPSGARMMIARGSTTALDWTHDFDALQTNVDGARVSDGFWKGVGPILTDLDAALA